MVEALVISLALTLAIEAAFAFVMKKRGYDLLLCALVNVVTNPAAVLMHLLFPGTFVVAACEAGAVIAEWLLYRYCGANYKKPFLFSLCANALSFGIGLLITVLRRGG